MDWLYYLPFILAGAVLGLLIAKALSGEDKNPPPAPMPPPIPRHRINADSTHPPISYAPTVRKTVPSVTSGNVPVPKVHKPAREAPCTITPNARSFDPINPKDYPVCPVCSAGNDLGEQMVFKLGPRHYR